MNQPQDATRLFRLLEATVQVIQGNNRPGLGDDPNTRAVMRAMVERHGDLKINVPLASMLLDWKVTCSDPYNWQHYAMLWGIILNKSTKLSQERRIAATAIGTILIEELHRGNDKTAEVLAKGLSNLRLERSFWLKPGPPNGGAYLYVAFAYSKLRSQGIDNPSQVEVLEYLEREDIPIDRSEVNDAFQTLGLTDASSDAREALSPAGRRRRKKKHVANQDG